MQKQTAHELAFDTLTSIEILTEPGQELTLQDAIDIICDVYNLAHKARIDAGMHG